MTLAAIKIKVTALDHVVLHVKDLPKSRHFYTEVLGMEIDHENERQCFVKAGNQLLALFNKDVAIHAGEGLDHIAFDVAEGSYESLKATLDEHGVKIEG